MRKNKKDNLMLLWSYTIAILLFFDCGVSKAKFGFIEHPNFTLITAKEIGNELEFEYENSTISFSVDRLDNTEIQIQYNGVRDVFSLSYMI